MSAMLGTGRNQLSRGLIRQVAKVSIRNHVRVVSFNFGCQARDVRTLASLSLTREATRKVTSSVKPVLGGFESGTSSSIYRTLYTTRVLGDEVKIIVCPAFADSISEGDIRLEFRPIGA